MAKVPSFDGPWVLPLSVACCSPSSLPFTPLPSFTSIWTASVAGSKISAPPPAPQISPRPSALTPPPSVALCCPFYPLFLFLNYSHWNFQRLSDATRRTWLNRQFFLFRHFRFSIF